MPPNSSDSTERFVESLAKAQSKLYGYILTLLPHPEAAMDVLQETNLVLWRKAAEFDPAREFIPWATRFAHFQVLAYRRDRAREHVLFSNPLLERVADQLGASLPAQDLRLAALERCLTKLPPGDRELIEQRYAEGSSVQAMAEKLNKSVGATSKVLFRIREVLQTCIGRTLAQ